MVAGDIVKHSGGEVKAEFKGLGNFYTKEYIDMDAVIKIVRAGKSKLETVEAIEAYQHKNRNIPVAMLQIPDRVATTVITTDKFIASYTKEI